MNLFLERNQKLQELFDKIEKVLQENVLVIANLEAKASKNNRSNETVAGGLE